jgi:hypothetical protein
MKKIVSAGLALLLLTGLLFGCEAAAPKSVQMIQILDPADGVSNFEGVVEQLETEGMDAGEGIKYLTAGNLNDAKAFLGAFLIEPELPEEVSEETMIVLLLINADVSAQVFVKSKTEGSTETLTVTVESGDASATSRSIYIVPAQKGSSIINVKREAAAQQ